MRTSSRGRLVAGLAVAACVVLGLPRGTDASTTQCATKWENFTGPNGFVTRYTESGQPIRDYETSSDPSNGPASVAGADLASGSPGAFPGPYSTTDFGYYDGGTRWNADNPATLEDDFILFRWRLTENPVANGGGLVNGKWNVLLDVDGDGYKEFWILADGNQDRVYLYYENLNRQDITSVDNVILTDGKGNPLDSGAATFTAYGSSIVAADTCNGTTTAGDRMTSHTRAYAANDGTGDYFLEVQIPTAAFDDLRGNQVLLPDSPVAYVYSTSASNTDPLQKDFMQQLQVGPINLANPINFGDVVTPSSVPTVLFTDAAGGPSDYYLLNGQAYVQVFDRLANANPNLPDSVQVVVRDPASGDDELVTLWETGSSTGVFTNVGGFCDPAQLNPAAPPQAWLTELHGTGGVASGGFTLGYLGSSTWSVTGPAGALPNAVAGTLYSAGGVSFTLYQGAPSTTPQTTLSFCSRASDPLTLSPAATVDAPDAFLRAAGGDTLLATYTSANATTVSDTNLVLGTSGCTGTAIIGFTRADGRAATNYTLGATTGASDLLYVTVASVDANTNPATAQAISVQLSGFDALSVTLTETGPNTGVFRNTTGVPSRVFNNVADGDDASVWEDVDGGTITATYSRPGCAAYTASAQIFVTVGGGDVFFNNEAGTRDVDTYSDSDRVFVAVKDANLSATTPGCAAALPPTVSIESRDPVTGAVYDSETVVLAESPAGSTVWRNSGGLLVRYSANPVRGNGTLEARNQDRIVVVYSDCNDGDSFTGNNLKYDYATFNLPDIVINRVLFAPDTTTVGSCQTELVELYNPTTVPLSLASHVLTDQDGQGSPDGVAYTFPASVGGQPLVLQPGEKAVVSFGLGYSDFYAPASATGPGTWYLFDQSESGFPSTFLAASDQLTLFEPGGTEPVDFVAWSNTPTNSLDWVNDDSAAVAAGLWPDNAFRQAIEGVDFVPGQAMVRAPDGYDRNLPADWRFAGDNTCSVIAAATRATLIALRAEPSGRIEFVTATQRHTRGFRVWATADRRGRERRLLTPEPIPARGATSLTPVKYEESIEPFGEPLVLLEEIETDGGSRWMGPFEAGDAVLAEDLGAGMARLLRGRSLRAVRQPRSRAGQRRGWGPREEPAVRIETAGAGIVTLGAAELREGGLDARLLRQLARLELVSQGRRVPFSVTPQGGIRFRAEALETDFTVDNVYVLGLPGSAPRHGVELTRLGPPLVAGLQRVEHDVYYGAFVPPGADPWFWDFAYDGYEPQLAFDLPGLLPRTGSVPVRLHVAGISSHEHQVDATLNGLPLGSVRFSGERPAVIEGQVDAAALRESGNVLAVRYAGEPLDYLGTITVDGLDLGVALEPSGAVTASVSPWAGWRDLRGVQYLIVAPSEFAAAAARLRTLKLDEGLRAEIVTTEEAYARYSFGIPDPAALRELIRRAGPRLRQVLLLGDDSIDPLDRTGLGRRSLVPSLHAHDGISGYVPSENLFADVDGDGAPDLAIGRLPAATAEEAELLVDKVAQQASRLAAAGGAQVFAVDNSNGGDSDFLGRAREVAAGAPGPQSWAVLGQQTAAQARASLDAGLRHGGVVHFFGHGSDLFWADEKLLTIPAAEQQAGSGAASVVFTWACNVQWYTSPFGPTVNEALLLAADGGAAAAFGPAGITRPFLQQQLSDRLYRRLAERRTLGEAIRLAKADTIAAYPEARVVVEGFNLLGDPALRLP